MKQNAIAIIAAIDTADGQAPEWVLMFKEGWNEVEGVGEFLVDRKAFDTLSAKLLRRGNDIVIDYEHQTIEGTKAPAAGWWKEIRYEDGRGIVARVDWTDEAAKYIVKQEYRYFSPVFYVRKSDKRVVEVHSVALTNAPKINHLTPLLAKLGENYGKKEEDMKEFLKKLAAKLGLAEDTGEDDVLAEVAKLKDKPPETKEVVAKEVLEALELNDGDTSVVVASIHALRQTTKGVVSREEFAKLQTDLKKRDAEEVVAKAQAKGKITPDQKDWAKDYAERDLEGFKTFIAKAPVVIPVDKLPDTKLVADAGAIDEATKTVAKMMDVSEEDIKKYGTPD